MRYAKAIAVSAVITILWFGFAVYLMIQAGMSDNNPGTKVMVYGMASSIAVFIISLRYTLKRIFK